MRQIADNKPLAILLMGPTTSGKTALAQALCDRAPCEIINVDSAQFYRDMDIGSAKPDAYELDRYPHHMLSFLDPSEYYSVGQFRKEAIEIIAQIVAKGNIPLLVGGSMLHFKVLIQGISDLPQRDSVLRQRLERVTERKGLAFMHAWLARVDPSAAKRLHPNDPQRILRALEVYLLSGDTLSELHARDQQGVEQPCAWRSIVLFPQRRDWLHEKISNRFNNMLDSGFLKEVERLYQRSDLNLHDSPALRAVGYRQLWNYLDGQVSYENMKERGIIATRQLAKRQYTWLRGWSTIDPCTSVFDTSELLMVSGKQQLSYLNNLSEQVLAYLQASV